MVEKEWVFEWVEPKWLHALVLLDILFLLSSALAEPGAGHQWDHHNCNYCYYYFLLVQMFCSNKDSLAQAVVVPNVLFRASLASCSRRGHHGTTAPKAFRSFMSQKLLYHLWNIASMRAKASLRAKAFILTSFPWNKIHKASVHGNSAYTLIPSWPVNRIRTNFPQGNSWLHWWKVGIVLGFFPRMGSRQINPLTFFAQPWHHKSRR